VSPESGGGCVVAERDGTVGRDLSRPGIFPGLEAERAERAVAVLARLRRKVDLPLALAALFAGCPTDFAVERCRILKLSKNHTRHITFLLSHRDVLLDFEMPLSRLKTLLAKPYFRDLYELERAIQKAAAQKANLAALLKLRRRIRDLGDVDVAPDPLLTGHDLIGLGAVPGPSLAEELYIAQLEGELRTKEQAARWARDWLEKHRRADE